MSIEVSHLLKKYGEQKAVNDVSFSVGKAEIVGFLGPNGAGKSTTMKMITGYLAPDAGEISVCGIDVKKFPLESKKKTGYLPEANPLYYDMYVREYLDFIAGVYKISSKKSKIEDVINLTGLTPEAAKKTGQLSKGYKQRVGLAAALIHDPEVLILDEPTTGLDPNQIIEIREVIRNLGKNKTVLFSSHILQEVEALCDRIIVINKGEMVADERITVLQNNSQGQSVSVSFREALEEEWIKRIPAVISYESPDKMQWKLQTNNPDLLKKQLLEMSLQHNLNIVSLQSENKNLEEIFRSLTRKEN
ncbi:gliding motility-associated ABC transporter ATP-binding subunit GldA [Pollutibacter soli]|uniref:gliding motility-associated ABC transporter ATP-binding subunit GldA n=1 Tax=Pollutibacter soli TaxID=3034157 RepID=UPI003013D4CB